MEPSSHLLTITPQTFFSFSAAASFFSSLWGVSTVHCFLWFCFLCLVILATSYHFLFYAYSHVVHILTHQNIYNTHDAGVDFEE